MASKSTDIFETLDDLMSHHATLADGEASPRTDDLPPRLLPSADSWLQANVEKNLDVDLEVCEESHAAPMKEISIAAGRREITNEETNHRT
jgi:hypothetical protein